MTDLFHSKLLIESLVKSPLLVDQLGDYPHFDRSFLNIGELETSLNFSQKLGHLYEDALEQVLRSSSRVSNLHTSVQVFEGKRTVGEFDYLFRLDDELIHLELAVKFYCAVHIDSQLRWYGPDARDHWDRKRERMLSHQLELAQTEEGKDTIENLCGGREAQTRHLIYGKLFDHVNTELEIATDVSENASRGKWLWRSELAENVTSENLWLVPKCLWPCEVSESLLTALERKTQAELLDLSQERAVMFTDGVEFFFLVHDHWLESAG